MTKEPKTPTVLSLMVDDSIPDIMLMEHVFKKLATPFAVIKEFSGRSGLARAKKAQPDFIILDLTFVPKMAESESPIVDGLQTLAELKADTDTAHIPVIILSGSERPQDRTDALALGAERFLAKPRSLQAGHALAAELSVWWFSR